MNSKNGNIIVGTITSNIEEAERYHEVFNDYLKKHFHFRPELEISRELWNLPLVFPDFNILFRFNNVFFAGEVAGFLNPFGEGISIAMQSGQAIAMACMDVLNDRVVDYGKIENQYMLNIKDEYSYMLRQWDYLKDISPMFFQNVLKTNF
ncbi:MAG: hypothetical protein HC831_05315 [Chloroflexia bacterium]|nr:hypothetical protein [Chloroflexia bacterium]